MGLEGSWEEGWREEARDMSGGVERDQKACRGTHTHTHTLLCTYMRSLLQPTHIQISASLMEGCRVGGGERIEDQWQIMKTIELLTSLS